MYIYLLVFMLCLLIGILGQKFKVHYITIKIEIIVLTFLLMFRYGQGTDYFGYNYLFNTNSSFFTAVANITGHGEIGFRLICAVFNGNYQLFVLVVSLYQCYMLYRFLSKYCINKAFSLLLFFPTIYLTYYFSSIRQGIIIATFLGVGISLIEKKAWKQYIFMCVLLATIHSVAIVFIIIPLVDRIPNFFPLFWILIPVAAIIGFVLGSGIGKSLLVNLPYVGPYLSSYLQTGYSWFAIAERILTLLFVLVFYYSSSYNKQGEHPWWIKAYICGYIIYFLLMPFSTLSTRILICFRALEIMFIPNLIKKERNKYKQVLAMYFIVLSIVMYAHNINSYIIQGKYSDSISIINYPYVSIFNKDDIWHYRGSNLYFELLD